MESPQRQGHDLVLSWGFVNLRISTNSGILLTRELVCVSMESTNGSGADSSIEAISGVRSSTLKLWQTCVRLSIGIAIRQRSKTAQSFSASSLVPRYCWRTVVPSAFRTKSYGFTIMRSSSVSKRPNGDGGENKHCE